MHRPGDLSRFRSELRALLALAIPVILSELGWVAMGVVDTIMVGKLGSGAIGAVGISSAAYYAPALFGIGILLGLDTMVSQAWGRQDFHVCHEWLAQGVYLAIAYTPLAMAAIWAVPLLFVSFGINPAVSGDATVYLRILNLGTLPLLIYAAFRRYLQGVGRVRPVTFTLVSANLINWGGNWALIYGHLGLPAMGLKGSAVSTCLARIYMAAVLVFLPGSTSAAAGTRSLRIGPEFIGNNCARSSCWARPQLDKSFSKSAPSASPR